MSTPSASTTRGPSTQGRSELGVALLLLVLGGWAVGDALRLPDVQARGPVDAKTIPLAVGALLILTALLLAVDVLRGGRGEQEAGEDVDLGHGSDWKTLGLLTAAFVANILLIDRLGWPVSGAVLFFGTTYALGSRHPVRNAIISIALSVGTWYLFNLALGIALPVGILKGIL
ncbi:tripartite tricarboxylate transporter TctB family protein [Kribbella turkmenica]|uniref:Tripartite tricarboxylate transporter TctB family protein n=1 Tax=Kribbella turkmenica TaxID=2530375 RepID=A0A4R4XCK7_9ACTN|nr:tripartite tricarboxylate transporter TctB family protein [Kribbella turkmenica]TDD28335.1 tripartite tricarboxylate transporter TctB family protein [Kribbella turkmenica]